jgi:hypothetical protein
MNAQRQPAINPSGFGGLLVCKAHIRTKYTLHNKRQNECKRHKIFFSLLKIKKWTNTHHCFILTPFWKLAYPLSFGVWYLLLLQWSKPFYSFLYQKKRKEVVSNNKINQPQHTKHLFDEK